MFILATIIALAGWIGFMFSPNEYKIRFFFLAIAGNIAQALIIFG